MIGEKSVNVGETYHSLLGRPCLGQGLHTFITTSAEKNVNSDFV
jgi:hypothetical protein